MSVAGLRQRHEILQASLRCRLELDQTVDVRVYDDSWILKLVGDLFPYLLEIIVLNHFGIDQVICITYKGLVQVMKLDGVGVAAWTHQSSNMALNLGQFSVLPSKVGIGARRGCCCTMN